MTQTTKPQARAMRHFQHAKARGIGTACTAHHVNFGGACLNCGFNEPAPQPPADSCGAHYPNPCAGPCPNRGDRFSGAQIAAQNQEPPAACTTCAHPYHSTFACLEPLTLVDSGKPTPCDCEGCDKPPAVVAECWTCYSTIPGVGRIPMDLTSAASQDKHESRGHDVRPVEVRR